MCRRVCQVVAESAPETPPPRLAIVVRYALWSVILDDRLDGPGPDRAALSALRGALAEAVTPTRPPPADRFAGELRKIVDELAAHAPQGAARFGAAVLDTVDTSITHTLLGQAGAAGTAPAPTVEEYLAVAARTINYHSFGYALLAVAAGRLTGPELAVVEEALEPGAAAVRLANDLRSLARDRAERTLNVLELRTAAGAALTRAQVADLTDERMRRHDEVLAALGPSPAAAMLVRSLRRSVGLYRRTDLR
jgi:hypothetical protein